MRFLKYFSLAIYMFLYLLVFQGCVKDLSNEYPSVQIIKPYENQIFQVNDTIPIEANISYSSVINAVMITLCDENYIHIMPSYSVYLKTNTSQKINFIYPLDDDFLVSGNYYLEISVVGDQNTKNKYVRLHISGHPKENKGLGVIVKNGKNTDLIFIDSAWQPYLQKTFSGNHIASSYLPFHNIFTEITDGSSEATAINFFSGEIKWSVKKTVVPIGPYFTATYSSERNIDILFYDNKAETYSYDGKKKGNFQLHSNYYPDIALNDNDLWFVYERKKTNPKIGFFSIYYPATGALIKSYSIDFEIMNFFRRNNNELVIFGNKNGKALVKVYYIDDNVFWEPRTLEALPLEDAVQIDAETYLFLQDKNLIKFDLSHAWLFDLGEILGSSPFKKMKYDELNNYLYLSNYHEIKTLVYPSLGLINNYVSNDSIEDFQIIYNN